MSRVVRTTADQFGLKMVSLTEYIEAHKTHTLTQFLADDILSEKLGQDDHLGLEHPNRNRSQWVKYESLNIR